MTTICYGSCNVSLLMRICSIRIWFMVAVISLIFSPPLSSNVYLKICLYIWYNSFISYFIDIYRMLLSMKIIIILKVTR